MIYVEFTAHLVNHRRTLTSRKVTHDMLRLVRAPLYTNQYMRMLVFSLNWPKQRTSEMCNTIIYQDCNPSKLAKTPVGIPPCLVQYVKHFLVS